MTIVLAGDSIFDNLQYVDEGECVSDVLSSLIDNEVCLIAVDGDTTLNILDQLKRYPKNATHLFISCGGNDALGAVKILNELVSTVHEALTLLHKMIDEFRLNYSKMLDDLLAVNKNLIVCTIYNKSPSVFAEATTALALFNEVILEEALRRKLAIIDLRLVCNEKADYSVISPIEPSFQGSKKIAACIRKVLKHHDFKNLNSVVYT